MALSAKELVTQYKDEYEYCEKAYMEAWNSIIVDVDENASENKKTAFIQSMANFPEVDE